MNECFPQFEQQVPLKSLTSIGNVAEGFLHSQRGPRAFVEIQTQFGCVRGEILTPEREIKNQTNGDLRQT